MIDDDNDDFSSGPAHLPSGDSPSSDRVEPPNPNWQTWLPSRFTFRRDLGKGGQGNVIEVFDTKMERIVAFKYEKTNSTQVATDRFVRRNRLVGDLRHPNIVQVFEVEAAENGCPAFALFQIATGCNLKEAILNGQLALDDALSAFCTICRAVEHAHSKHLIHRDLKPENVIIDHGNDPIIIDWGLAKFIGNSDLDEFVDPESNEPSKYDGITTTGLFMGSPDYMAPEQACGDPRQSDNRTDI